MTIYWTAFILGLGGSIHCAGMCTPLVVALTATRGGSQWKRKVIYNSGRILTYSILGGLVGLLGSALDWTSYQDVISVALGIFLILFAAAGFSQQKIPVITTALQGLTITLKKLFSRFLTRQGNGPMFFLGMINGLLPCGLTYLALTSCLAVSSAMEGIFFMLIFGGGTLGVMLGLSGFLSVWIRQGKFNFQKMTTVLLVLAGILLITRAVINHSDHLHHAGQMTILCR